MLSLRELRRAVEALARERLGARLERAMQRGESELVLTLSGGGHHPASERCHLVLDASRRHARLALRERAGPAPARPPAFAQWLRAHLEGGRLEEARLRSGDRLALLRFETKHGSRALLLSILGPRSNVYALDADDRLLAALRPVGETRRDLAVGEPWRDPESRPPAEGDDRFQDAEGEELLVAIEARYAEEQRGAERAALRRRIVQALRKQESAHARKERALRGDLEQAAEAEAWKRRGELLKGSLGSVRRGADQVTLRDFESGEGVVVPLDPKLSPAENMERCFKRHRKALRLEERASKETGVLEERREGLRALRRRLEAIPEDAVAELAAFAEEPEVRRLLERFAPKAPPSQPEKPARPSFKLGKRELPMRLVPKRYRTRDGLEIWVGKSDEGNDILTTRLARGNDLFFHLEGSPGSHVILRTEGRKDPPQESLLEACELAVHFSKQKHAGRAGVHVAPIKDVSKPKGAKPGLVYVHRGYTVSLRRDPKRLERILAARIDH